MKQTPLSTIALRLAATLAVTAWASVANAQTQVYSQNFDVDDTANWKVNATAAGYHPANIFFDYSTVGIPSAPHSVGGTTRGIKLQANLDTAAPTFGGVSVSPLNFGITENFEMHWDQWINFNGPFPGGGSGSTQIGGGGYGTSGNAVCTAGVGDAIFIGASGDGGTSSDYRVYSPGKIVSYQAGSYVIGSTFNCGESFYYPGDSSSGFVYAGNAGGRANDSGGLTTGYYATNFPGVSATNTCPTQLALYPQQTGITVNGAIGMKWRDVSLRKVANRLTYRIDGVLIATIDTVDATIGECCATCTPPITTGQTNTTPNAFLGGTNILFNHYDINAGASTDPNRTNLAFTLIDNVRITNFPNVVSVLSTVPGTAEGSASDAVFTITRTASGVPITVNYTLLGSAVNGVDYTNLPGSVTLAATATATNIYVHAIDDLVAEPTETVIMEITPDPNFVAGGSATVTISDNESPALAITSVSSQMYERTNDFATFRITRLGSTNTPSFNVNLSFSGSATYGADFYTNAPVTFDPGVQSVNFNIYPIQDSLYEGNEIVTAQIAAAGGGEYAIGSPSSASITIIDANGPPETVLWSDNFNTDSSASWSLKFASTNELDTDYTALFAFDYSSQNIPPAPHGSGDTLGLFLTVNKDATPTGAALNLYPLGQNFSGNFALRFDMFLNMVAGGSSTEYALFGINHSGNKTNWWHSGGVPAGWTFDGIFYAVETDAQSTPNYVNYSSPTTAGNNPTALTAGVNNSAFTAAFKAPPWAVAGGPAMNVSSNTPVWADVELSKIGDIVTLRINNTTIFSYSNATAYTAGNIMLGYEDAFDSIGTIQNYVVYDNVRVVSLNGLKVTATADLGANVQIDFTFDLNDTPAAFAVQTASAVIGPYADVSASIVQLSPGVYRATVAKSGAAQFSRIRHL